MSPNSTAKLKLKLTAAGRKALQRARGHRLKATLTLVFSPTNGSRAVTVKQKLTLVA